jgi:alkylation response protein AidB-like acyl-CoA dehydrogenase
MTFSPVSAAASTALPTADFLEATAQRLAADFEQDAAERDRRGGAPHAEIAQLRSAGLLTATVPRALGGAGLSWRQAMRLVRTVARADASLAQLLGYHYLIVQTPLLRGTPEQAQRYLAETAAHGLYWGAAVNPRDPDITLTPDADGFRLSGKHTFATGASLADRLAVRVVLDGAHVQVVVPGNADGITHHGDWDSFGQRLTESGTVSFRHVRVERADVLGGYPVPPPQAVLPSSTLLTPMMQLVFVNFYLGAAQGALNQALDYVRTTTRPWQTSGVVSASQDPYILELAGHLTADVQATEALAETAGVQVDEALALGTTLTAGQRRAAAATVYAAKVNATRTALDVTSRIFELMGARATANRHGFDRYWRNVRVHTLHDPVAYKAREVGNYALNGEITPDPLYT